VKLALFALAVLLGTPSIAGTPPPPNDAFCRFAFQPVGFPGEVVSSRTLDPYVGTAPLTHITGEVCLASLIRAAAEALDEDTPGTTTWVHADLRFELALDAAFTTKFVDEFVTNPSVTFVLDPFDGVFDFAGLSGVMHDDLKQALVEYSFDVKDEAFFRQPFPVWMRVTSPGGVTLMHSGHVVTQFDHFGSGALAMHFNGVVKP